MKKTIFYFSGNAGDLSLALLKRANADMAVQNKRLHQAVPSIKWSMAMLTGEPVRKLSVKHL